MSDLSSVKESHPVLYKSVVSQYNRYLNWVKEDKNLAAWVNNFDGIQVLDDMSDALLLHPEVQALGDQRCKGMFPLYEDVSTPQVPVARDAKIKLKGPYGPTVFALLETALIQVAPQHDEDVQLQIWGKEDVMAAVPVKMTKLWASSPGIQFVLKGPEGRRVVAVQVGDLIPARISRAIQDSLTTW